MTLKKFLQKNNDARSFTIISIYHAREYELITIDSFCCKKKKIQYYTIFFFLQLDLQSDT